MAGCRIAPPMCNHACDLMPLNPIISTRSSQNKIGLWSAGFLIEKVTFEISSVEIYPPKKLSFPLNLAKAFLKNIHQQSGQQDTVE